MVRSADAVVMQLERILIPAERVAVTLVNDARRHQLLLAVWTLLELCVLEAAFVAVLLVELV